MSKKNSLRPAFRVFRELTFLLALLGLFALSHLSVDFFLDGNRLRSVPISVGALFPVQMSLAIVVVTFPVWVVLQMLDPNRVKPNKEQENAVNVVLFLLAFFGLVQAIHFVFLLLSVSATLQSLAHFLVTMVITLVGGLYIYNQNKVYEK